MSAVLMASPPIHGHVLPIVEVAAGLTARGHAVTVLTGAKYRDPVEHAGATFAPLPAEVDYDDADLDAYLPGRGERRGTDAVRYDMIGMFMRPIPGQFSALSELLRMVHPDAVVVDAVFLGALALVLGTPREQRPPVFTISSVPLTLSGPDVAPFGLALQPGSGPIARLRNRLLNAVAQRVVFRPVTTALVEALRSCAVEAPGPWFFDAGRAFERNFQLTLPDLEYPRRNLPASVSFLGPLQDLASSVGAMPAGWDEVAGTVVHVTQGTIDNTDPTRLLVPTIRALTDEPLTVVATTGGRDVSTVLDHFPAGLPRNAIVAEYLPYERLLPKTSLVVTNGGFGGVQRAVRHGIPLVVAGDTEEKPEVAARVEWAGVGVDLRTGHPTDDVIADAVRRVLGDARYRENAHRVAARAPRIDPVDVIAEAIAHETEARMRDSAMNSEGRSSEPRNHPS